jgi:hypothetical protein
MGQSLLLQGRSQEALPLVREQLLLYPGMGQSLLLQGRSKMALPLVREQLLLYQGMGQPPSPSGAQPGRLNPGQETTPSLSRYSPFSFRGAEKETNTSSSQR